jgi:hypothetical protein
MKRITCMILALVLAFGATGAVFAAEPASAAQPAMILAAEPSAGGTPVLISAPVATIPSLDAIAFEGPAIEVDMETVIEHRLTEGPAIELALINKRSDEAVARGYREALDLLSFVAPGSLNTKLTEMTRDFARANLDTNHEAALNKIRKDGAELFLNTFRAQEYRRVAEEDLAATALTLKNVQRKFELGAASRLDVMTATNAKLAAEKALAEAKVGHAGALMNFNMEMGYPLLQDAVLRADLAVPALPAVDLDASIASALAKRNEVGGVKFAFDIQDASFRNAKLTKHPLSSDYKKQEVAWLKAKQAADTIENQIRADVMLKYMGLAQKHLAALAAESTANLAKEAYRIAQLSYGAGLNTLADLQAAEVAAGQAGIMAIGAVTDLTLALLEFDFAAGVGTFRISLSGDE